MFKRNPAISGVPRPLRDTELKTEATNSYRPGPEVNLGGPLPDALPDNADNTIELLKRLWPAADVEVYLLVEKPELPTASEVNEAPVAAGPEPDWPYKEVTDICYDVFEEVKRAINKHAGMNSPHEGHSVIREEFEELWAHVLADTGRSPEARKEAIQVAAMAVRYILDLIPAKQYQ